MQTARQVSLPLIGAVLHEEPHTFLFMSLTTGIQSRYSTQFPAEITTAATFDRDLFYRRAYAMGAEYARLGAHIPLSLAVGPMGRSVYGGRNWEGFSADSFLAGEAIRYSVQAFQENKVTALVKHFVGSKSGSNFPQLIGTFA